MSKRLNGWQRIGVVLSIVWCIGYASYFWITGVNDINATPLAPSVDFGAAVQLQQDVMTAKTSGLEFQMVTTVPANCLTALAIGWLSSWGMIAAVRWIRRGFPIR